ncbi:MAG: hypothetical protein C5B47_02880 [Verrucomicrobia bacterium]|nr:MAG: hypothetical protein C5B47_02880 [Verrucomicrobiota bacterium]
MRASRGFIKALENGREVSDSFAVTFENKSEKPLLANSLRTQSAERPILTHFRGNFNEYYQGHRTKESTL